MKTVLALVLSADMPKYTPMIQAIKETWAAYRTPSFSTLFYFGRNKEKEARKWPPDGEVIQQGVELYYGCIEEVYNINLKTVMIFDYVLKNYKFDYIYRSCLGTYIAPPLLLKYLETAPSTMLYSGILARLSPDDAFWVSGSGYSLSRDLVEIVVSHKKEILAAGHGSADDVCLGRLLRNFGVVPMFVPRVDGTEIKEGCFHHHGAWDLDPSFMHKMHKAFKDKGAYS